MRKIVYLVMLMMCVAAAKAQWYVTPEAGMNVTTYKDTPSKIGFKAGAAVGYTFGSGLFSLQSGLYYVQRGTGKSYSGVAYGKGVGKDGKTEYLDISFAPGYMGIGGSNGWAYINSGYGAGINGMHLPMDMTIEGITLYEGSFRKDYLQLPILARFNWQIGKDVRLHLAAGPYLACGLGGKEVRNTKGFSGNDEYSETNNSVNPFTDGGYRRFDWGATINAGIEVKRVAFNIGYDMGLGKQHKYDSIDLKYHTVSFTVGYTF